MRRWLFSSMALVAASTLLATAAPLPLDAADGRHRRRASIDR